MEKRATVSDVAALANVSSATVSNVISNRTGKVSAKTRQRVLDAIKALNYTYNENAATLRSNKSNIIGLVIHDLSNPYYTELIAKITRNLAKLGYATILACSDENLESQQSYLHQMKRHNALAVLLCPTWDTTAEHLEAWRETSPTLTFLRPVSNNENDYIGIDNYQAAYDLTKQLIDDGHQHIAFIGGRQHSRLRRQRLQGWKDAHEDINIRWQESRIIECASSMTAGASITTQLMQRDSAITALVCYQDIVAFGAMNALQFAGKIVGTDVAVTGFDGLSDAEGWLPSLTTAEVQIAELTQHIVSRLLERLENHQAPPTTTLLHARIHWRHSTRAI
ncbi:TPA: LacI family DNA-binding transcriptional regulator [Raoultella ornithinolytica]|uniref:LacI family DNA-binding transcriptional regulator n=1 Tax=Raoultella ornithinolytica TaxID=54291 RepID=UPI001BA28190|nr:LacI family DNA-binding transcriptional regulator [Raoultella ornithinolytica]HCE8951367.1 LacI family DNA-binding transcriptional regulator [Raoultella ornithinolytica]HDH7845173.1 LacI family DNA-binding transcriptional regulator [Raoultella ornithinolytica]